MFAEMRMAIVNCMWLSLQYAAPLLTDDQCC